jgi:hypothetical protein
MLKFLRKILNKKNNMENPQEIDIEYLDNELKIFSYKWTKGDRDGQVCEYESIFKDPTTGIIWVNFKDGSRINHGLMNEYMMSIEPFQLGNTQVAKIIATPEERAFNNVPVKNVMLPENNSIKADSNPIVSLLEKQKPNWVEVGIKLKLNLPTKNLYQVLTSSFEDADEEIIEFVVKDLDLEIIKESLRINIREIYKSNGSIKKGGNITAEDQ